jgi:hypothetical protein
MINEGYYEGSDLKFQIDISATGFDQNSDRYNIDFYCGDRKISFTQDDVISSDGKFYLPVPTAGLEPGMMKIVVTAFVPDSDFTSGYRKEIAVRNLKYLKKIL